MENNKKTKEYWEKRARENENKVYAKGSEVKKVLEEHYLKARKEIRKSVSELVARYMDKTELSYIEAVKYLTSSEFKEWRMTLEEYEEEIKRLEKISPEFARKLRIELETLATKSRITRLESLNAQIDMELAKKSIKDYDVIRDGVSKTYSDFFKIQTTEFGLDGVNTVLPKKTIEMLMQQPWSGSNFSERIWDNSSALARVLKQEIIQAFMQGVSVKDLSDRIEKRFENDRYNTERLVRTELNYALNQSTKLSYDEAGIKEYEFLAEIDSRTSDICRELNGQIFKMKDARTGVNYPPMHPHCYDKETEIYTNQGWKYFKDLDKTEMVYTINPETLNVEWQKPINYISYKHQGKVLHYKNTRFNLMVTPQHKLLIQNMDNSVKDKSWKLKEAIEVGRKSKNRMLSGINWLGKKKEFETLAGKEIDIELYLKFMAYWLADGSCTKDRGSYNIKIAQCENDWMYEELKEIPFKIYKCKESLIIHNKELGKELSRFGKCTEKYIPENIKELNPELIRIFLMAYAKTDGHIRKGKNWKGYQFNDSIVFFTTSDKMASDLGELILKAGGRPSYYLNKIQGKEIEFKNGKYTINKDCWVISWNTQIHTWISSLNIDEIEYNDNVYCVEVPKYNTVLVRRKGKICWSGNCRSTTIPVMNYEDIKTRKTKPKSEDDKKNIEIKPEKNGIIKIKDKFVFKISNTIEEATNYARQVLNIRANYSKFNLEVANLVNEEITKFYNVFGNLKEQKALDEIDFGSHLPESAVAAYNRVFRTIFMKNVKAKTAIKTMKKQAIGQFELGFWSTNNFQHVIRHEAGHAIQHMILDKNPEKAKLIEELRKEIANKYGVYGKENWLKEKRNFDKMKIIGEEISYYALYTDGELVAESVAEYMAGNPRDIAKKVMEILLKED